MIYDCFPFFNELDVLEMRFTQLDAVVDRFVLCESTHTYRGTPKPLWYAENAQRYARWHHKIVHLVYDAEVNANPWVNEWFQRAHLTRALADGKPDDIVLVSDTDEIPDPAKVGCLAAPGKILGHRHALRMGYFNCAYIGMATWTGTRAIRLGDIAALGSIADVRNGPSEALEQIDSGWHLTSLGGAHVMQEKMFAYSHSELDVPYYTNQWTLDVEFASTQTHAWRPILDTDPAFFRDPRWATYVWDEPAETPDAAIVAHAHGCFAYVAPDPVRVLGLTDDVAAWTRAGRARFGAAFAGAETTLAALAGRLEARTWLVADGFERLSDRELAVLGERHVHVVAYSRNSRSHDAIVRALAGEAFPRGRTAGVAEACGRLAERGWAIERSSLVGSRWIFAPVDMYPATGTFERDFPPFHFLTVTRDDLMTFLSHAFIVVFST